MKMAVIGECMLELVHTDHHNVGASVPMAMSYGGDTINTSIYLSRAGLNVSYVTGLGDDINSQWLLQEWTKEGIDCRHVQCMENSVPGLYMINVDAAGERSFLYWRKNSPASRLFDDPNEAERLIRAVSEADCVYLSGISLAILPSESLARLLNLLAEYRQAGGQLIFDGNYRPTLWTSKEAARRAYAQMYRMTDIALPTFEDESLLFGYESTDQVIDALRKSGVTEMVIKMGAEGCLSLCNDQVTLIEAQKVTPVDTTAAGDSFNAGYLAARFNGDTCAQACRAGHRLASKVIQHQGAIIPREVLP